MYSLESKKFKKEDIFFVLILITIGICKIYGIDEKTDIQFGDEAFYLNVGYFPRWPIMPDWGPLYSLWYAFLKIFVTSPVDLYFLNQCVLAVMAPVMLFLAIRNHKIGSLWAFYVAIVFCTASINYPEGVKNSIFVFCLVCLALICMKNNHKYDSIVLFMVSNLITFVRPEAFLFIGCVLVFQLYLVYRKELKWRTIVIEMAFLCFFWVVLGSPIAFKAVLAIKMDFAANYAMLYPEKMKGLNGWVDFDRVFAMAFGNDVNSFFQALLKNPKLMWEVHILNNHKGFINNQSIIVKDFFRPILLLPHKRYWLPPTLILICVFFYKKIDINYRKVKLETLLYVLFSLAPVIFACYYSSGYKFRYLPLFYLFYGVLVGKLISGIEVKKNGVAKALMFGIVITLAFTASYVSIKDWNAVHASLLPQKRVQFYQILRQKLEGKTKLRVFESTDKLKMYLGWENVEIAKYKREEDFESFLNKNEINFLYFDKELYEYLIQQPNFNKFIASKPANWKSVYSQYSKDLIFIRKDLVHRK